MTPRMISA